MIVVITVIDPSYSLGPGEHIDPALRSIRRLPFGEVLLASLGVQKEVRLQGWIPDSDVPYERPRGAIEEKNEQEKQSY